MSQLVQTEPRIAHARLGFSQAASLWPLGLIASLSVWLYWSTIARLVHQWWRDPNFSHGFFVPLFSAFVLWRERDRLAHFAPRPSWSGLVAVVSGLGLLIAGQLGAELFLARTSLMLVLGGLVILYLGWNFFRAVLFPWACLILMIPIPSLILSHITFPLQLLVSRVSAGALERFGVPVGLEGNVLKLAAMPLEVAEACSGIRSLMSLVTLAIIYGYLMEKRLWVRWLLALASIPIAIAANCIRIIGTGLLVQYWDAEKAEGYFHASWGLIIFVISLLMLYAVHALINLIWREKSCGGTPRAIEEPQAVSNSRPRFALAVVLIAASAIFLQAHAHWEVFPPRLPLQSFPEQLGTWTGTDVTIPKDELAVLGPGEFLEREYQDQEESPPINLFVAYYPSQSTNDTPHSPQNCLPGAGWTPIENKRVTLTLPAHAPFPSNRYLVANGDVRQMVLYWFWAHDRGIASEYSFKYYLVKDSLTMRRSDGALVRLITGMYPGETAEAAERRLLPFASQIVPILDRYVPR